MPRRDSLILLALLPIANCHGQPMNAANYRVPGLPGSDIAQGSIFVVFGERLGPAGLERATTLPLKSELSGTSVRVTIGSHGLDALPIYTSAGQVAAILPSSTPPGNGIVTVTYEGRTSNAIEIQVTPTSFGAFSRDQTGAGPGIVQNIGPNGEAVANAFNASAAPGQTAVIWGTGLGPISASDASAPPLGDLPVEVTVFVGGQEAKVLYKGRSPQFPGLDQINFEVPSGIEGCRVPVTVSAGGVVGNVTSMSVSSRGATCSDPASVSPQDTEAASRNGRSSIGLITLERASFFSSPGAPDYRLDNAHIEFQRLGLDSFLSRRGSPAPGACTSVSFRIDPNDPSALDVKSTATVELLDGGPAFLIAGPAGSVRLEKQSWGGFDASIGGGVPGSTPSPLFLEPGRFSFTNGRGGNDVGGFQTLLDMPGPIRWTNIRPGDAIQRGADYRVEWTGGDPDSELAFVRATSTGGSAGVRGVVTCVAALDQRSLTIPAELLSSLPATDGNVGVFGGVLEVGTISRLDRTRFTAPGLDGGYVQVRRIDRISATFQ